MKTARFSSVVAACGTPTPHLAWVAPDKDPSFQSALKTNRVMTLHQELRGGKKDHAEVGYSNAPHAQHLIFPKSLRSFEGMRIVGIDYDLFAKEPDPLPQSPRLPTQPSDSDKRAPDRLEKQSSKRAGLPAPERTGKENGSPLEAKPEGDSREEKPQATRAAASTPPEDEAPSAPPRSARTETKKTERPHEHDDAGRTLADLEGALRALKRGKTVAAYERLQQLADRLKSRESES